MDNNQDNIKNLLLNFIWSIVQEYIHNQENNKHNHAGLIY